MARPAQDWIASAVAITPGFETSGDPYRAAVGDFDGMGISCGALQWNIGKGSLQPMVIAVGQAEVWALMPTFGQELWAACGTSVSRGLAIVRSWQSGTTLRARPKAELQALMGSPAMREQQRIRIEAVAQRAFDRAAAWASEAGRPAPSKRLFCWFFDIVTQNGGLEGLTPGRVSDFIRLNSPDRVDDLICDFLATRAGPSGHITDAKKNGAAWRDTADAEKLEILCMSYLRSGTAAPRWRHVVLNRKGTIAMGKGWVNSARWEFSAHGL